MDVYCHEYFKSTVPTGQVCLSLGNGCFAINIVTVLLLLNKFILSFVRKGMFVAMNIVTVLFLLDKFVFCVGRYCDIDIYGYVCL